MIFILSLQTALYNSLLICFDLCFAGDKGKKEKLCRKELSLWKRIARVDCGEEDITDEQLLVSCKCICRRQWRVCIY